MQSKVSALLRLFPEKQQLQIKAALGNFDARERLCRIRYAAYAYGLRLACELAKENRINRISAVQIGFSDGRGIRNMVEIASDVSAYFGVQIDCFGLAFAEGMPEPKDNRDCPDLYIKGDFPVHNVEQLRRDIQGRATLYMSAAGDFDYSDFISNSISEIETIASAPIGYVDFDVDMYSLTKQAMRILELPAKRYLPTTPVFFDQSSGHTGIHRYCGELLAIDEFNEAKERKITKDTTIIYKHRHVPTEPWFDRCYLFQVFDHPDRRTARTAPHFTKTYATPRTEAFFKK